MGKVRIDLNALLLRIKDLPPAAGQAYTKTLKINEEITEAASGRLEMEFQFYPREGVRAGAEPERHRVQASAQVGERSRRRKRADDRCRGRRRGTPETSGGLSPSHSLRSPASRRGMMALAEDFVEREGTLSMDATNGKMLDSEIKALRKEKRKVDRAPGKEGRGRLLLVLRRQGKEGEGRRQESQGERERGLVRERFPGAHRGGGAGHARHPGGFGVSGATLAAAIGGGGGQALTTLFGIMTVIRSSKPSEGDHPCRSRRRNGLASERPT